MFYLEELVVYIRTYLSIFVIGYFTKCGVEIALCIFKKKSIIWSQTYRSKKSPYGMPNKLLN